MFPVPPSNPDDKCPSKSRLQTEFFVYNGTKITLEISSPYDGMATYRMGEIVLWRGPDGALTIKASDETDGIS